MCVFFVVVVVAGFLFFCLFLSLFFFCLFVCFGGNLWSDDFCE